MSLRCRFALASACLFAAILVPTGLLAAPPVSVLMVDGVGTRAGLPAAADLLAVTLTPATASGGLLRISFLSLAPAGAPFLAKRLATALPEAVPLTVTAARPAGGQAAVTLARCELRRGVDGYAPAATAKGEAAGLRRDGATDAVLLDIPAALLANATATDPVVFTITTSGGEQVTASYPADKAYEAHCALVLHGNQGLGYTDVFAGRAGDLEGSGFDEALQVHQATGIPGNFHVSGPLQTSAAWSRNNGDPLDFNGWLASGVTAGWAAMVTSAYAQHIMPFVRNEMNDWAVETETQMINTRYGYFPRVAWVPERVWLNTSGYPSSGVNDWLGDNFLNHGVYGVILDDSPHCNGHDNHRIHFLTGNGLRLIPRDRAFTGDIIGGNGQAALDILSGLAGSGVGGYRLAVFAEDWEAVAEMGSWATTTPNAKETYDWFVNKCLQENAWLHVWKLADALNNANFNGDTFSPTPGTYNEIGGTGGYGGGDNGWYAHWAGWVAWANGGNGSGGCAGGGNCRNYGQLWNDACNALMAAPDNNLSQAGWYCLMTNLYETAWHDGLTGPISGWEHQYSAHLRSAMVYAQAAHWANGEFATTTAAYLSDIDDDGVSEAVLHNDRVFAVFETIGGRATHLFVKGPGYNDTAIGNDNASWTTEGDYNDANHVGAFSDVSPNYQNDGYAIQIVSAAGPVAKLRLSRNEVTKDVSLATGDSFLDVVYRVGPTQHWLQSGFSPSLVDLVWNANLQRVWVADQAYMGRRNPNTGIAAVWVLGTGGAAHQQELSGTLMQGDEIRGSGTFEARLFVGPTSAPGTGGEIAELRAAATALVDVIGPRPVTADYFPTPNRLRLGFDQAALPGSVVPTAIGVDANADGVADLTLGAATTVSETAASFVLTLTLDAAAAAALEALPAGDLRLLMSPNAVRDVHNVGNSAVTAADLVTVNMGPALKIAVDGWIDPAEWSGVARSTALRDLNDSQWTSSNEIDRLRVTWDAQYLYVAIDGRVQGNSWLLYIDVDPGSANGQTNLTAISAWERGAVFTAPGFRPDFQFGSYQHQSVYDGDSFWQLTSPTTAVNRSGEVFLASDPLHNHGDDGGSELAIPWNTLYGLGDGVVPTGASIALVASMCWDPEPNGALGGDVAPNNTAATLPTVDGCWTLNVDPTHIGRAEWPAVVAAPATPPAAATLLRAVVPNPFNPSTTIRFAVPGTGSAPVRLTIHSLRGARVATLVDRELPAGEHAVRWNGRDDSGRPVAAGGYVCRMTCLDRMETRSLMLVK